MWVAALFSFQERGLARRVLRRITWSATRSTSPSACCVETRLICCHCGRSIIIIAALGWRARHRTRDRLWRARFGSFPLPVAASVRGLVKSARAPEVLATMQQLYTVWESHCDWAGSDALALFPFGCCCRNWTAALECTTYKPSQALVRRRCNRRFSAENQDELGRGEAVRRSADDSRE